MLGVDPALAVPRVRLGHRTHERRGAQRLVDARRPAWLELRQRWRETSAAHALIDFIGREQLGCEAPQLIERALYAPVAFGCAIAEPHQPAAAEAIVVTRLPHCLRRDRREARVGGVLEGGVQLELPGIDQPLPHDRVAEVAVRLLGEGEVQELRRISQEGERVLVAPAAFELAGIREEQPRLADEIEREIGEPQVLLERRRMANPLSEALAEHKRGVGKAQDVDAARLLRRHTGRPGHRQRRAHRFLTSSGMA